MSYSGFVKPLTGIFIIFIWVKEFKARQNKFKLNMIKHSKWKLSVGVFLIIFVTLSAKRIYPPSW